MKRSLLMTAPIAAGLAVLASLASIAAPPLEEKSNEHRTFAGVNDLIVDNVSGFIEVTASNGNSLEMDVAKILSADSQDRLSLAKKEIRLDVTQEGGLLRLIVEGPFRNGRSVNHEGYHFTYNFTLRVPRQIRLELSTVNDSHILVDGTSGEFRISNVNGPIEMKQVQGSGEVRTVNGAVKVTFARNPTAPVEFKSVNGTLDITFRHGLNANLMMKTMHGDLLTDFPVTALPVAVAVAPENKNGKFVWKNDRMAGVRVGSGGPELRFETLNGDVLIKDRER